MSERAMRRRGFLLAVVLSTPPVALGADPATTALEDQVAETERAFARTMAERDHAAFTAFLSEEVVFVAGTGVQRGKAEVAAAWLTYFAAAEAPFSWAPETVSVVDSGTLAISTGPVWDGAGKRTATYTSIWRQEEPRVWRIVFDRGTDACE